MKANYIEFETKLSIEECGNVFRRAVDKRPLKLKAARFKYFAPTQQENPFEALDGSIRPDFEVGAAYEFGELMGSVMISCLNKEGATQVILRSAGNMRGRMFTNSMVKHILVKFSELDRSIDPETHSERI